MDPQIDFCDDGSAANVSDDLVEGTSSHLWHPLKFLCIFCLLFIFGSVFASISFSSFGVLVMVLLMRWLTQGFSMLVHV